MLPRLPVFSSSHSDKRIKLVRSGGQQTVTEESKIRKEAASIIDNPSDSKTLLIGIFCFVCQNNFATLFCKMVSNCEPEIIDRYAYDSRMVKDKQKASSFYQAFRTNSGGACCCCCQCNSCSARVMRYRGITNQNVLDTNATNFRSFGQQYESDEQLNLLDINSFASEDITFDMNRNRYEMRLENEECYLDRIAGQISGLKNVNRRVKVDKFVNGKFISVCVPAAIYGGDKIIQIVWPEPSGERTSYRITTDDTVIASDEHYHHVLVLFNCKSRCSETPRHVAVCNCRVLVRSIFENVISYLYSNISKMTWEGVDHYVLSQLQTITSSQDLFLQPMCGLRCLECVHTKVNNW
jgi:hypothetical protein